MNQSIFVFVKYIVCRVSKLIVPVIKISHNTLRSNNKSNRLPVPNSGNCVYRFINIVI